VNMLMNLRVPQNDAQQAASQDSLGTVYLVVQCSFQMYSLLFSKQSSHSVGEIILRSLGEKYTSFVSKELFSFQRV
jgi:hypothetical protein